MRSGYYNPAGGAYLPTSQDNSVRPLPAVYLPNETQITMVAAQRPGEHRVAYDPAQWRQGFGQSQHFQDSRNFGISADANSIRQFADSSGQQKDSSKHNFSESLRNSSELSSNTGLSGQLSTVQVLDVGGPKFYTDYEIREYVKRELAYLRINVTRGPALSSKGCSNDNDSPLQSHCNIPKSISVACYPTSSTCDKEDVERPILGRSVVEHFTIATGQAVEEDRSKGSKANAELTPKLKETSETSASERLLTEYPQIMKEAAATCRKTDEESPVVLTALSGVTSDVLTEKYPGLILSCSTSQEESMSFWGNTDQDYRVPAVSSPLIHMAHKDRGDKGQKPVEVDSVQGMINDSKDSWTPRIIGDQDANLNKQKNIGNQQHSPVTSKKVAAHSNSSADKIQINDAQSVATNQSEKSVCNQTSCKGVRKDVCSQVDLSIALPDNKDAELTPPSERVDKDNPSVTILKEPQYEDISDAEDMSELDIKLREHEELHFSFHSEDPVYEDISEDENPSIQNTVVEMPSLTPYVSEPCVKPNGHVQVQVKSILDEELIPMKQVTPETETPSISQHCPHFDEPDDTKCVSGAKCDHARHAEWQTNRSCSPSSDLKDEDKTDDEMDDDWDVIPFIISELVLELPEDGVDPEDVLSDVGEHGNEVTQGDTSPTLCELYQPPPVQLPASAFSQIEVFDTRESFQQAKAVQFGNFSQFLSEESLPERDPKSDHSRRDSYSEPEDSCETDDSCNYSPVEESNHLTVSKKLLNNLSAPASPDKNDSESEVEATDLQNDQTRSRQNTCKKEDIIILNSDTEDECDRICANNAKRRKRSSSQNERPKRHSSETVASVCESVNENSSRRTENSGQLCKNVARSENVQHEAIQQNVSNDESIIIIDSDTEDESTQNYKKTKRKRESSSGWARAGDDPGVKQKRTRVGTEHETGKKKLQECRPSADSSKPRHGSKHRDRHSKEEMQDTSDLSHSIKTGQLPEAKTGSVCVQQKIKTQMTSKHFHESDHVVSADSILKKKATTKRRSLSSETENSDSAFVNAQKSSHVSNKPQRTGQSSKDSSEKQPQSGTNMDADATVSCNLAIPHLLVKNCPQSSGRSKFSKQFMAHGQGKDDTPKKPTSTSKNVDSCKTKTQLLHGDTQGKFASNPKPANDGHHVTPLSKSNRSTSCPSNISSSSRIQRQPSSNIPLSFIRHNSPTKVPSAAALVTSMWRNSYHATRKDKKPSVGMEGGSRPKKSHNSLKGAKPGRRPCDKAPRRRHSSQESATPLMKKTMDEARELTKARSRDASGEPTGCRVHEGYKWNK